METQEEKIQRTKEKIIKLLKENPNLFSNIPDLVLPPQTFKCPKCNQDFEDSREFYDVLEIRGKLLSSKKTPYRRGFIVKQVYQVYHVKVCKNCMKRRRMGKILMWVSFLVIIPFLLSFTGNQSLISGSFAVGFWLAALLNYFWDADVNIEQAKRDNALIGYYGGNGS